MANLDQLKKDLLADGIIDSDEVKTIKKVIYEDGKIDKDEADFLFELNDAVSGKVLEDEVSPNEIDDDEAEYLYDQIKGDGQVDDIERALLENIKAKAKNFPEILASLL